MANVGKVHTPGAHEHVTEDHNEQDETVTISKADLADMMKRLSAVEARGAPPPGRVEAQAALPDQTEVDASKIKSAVLSKQGWVLPSTPAVNAGKI